MNLRNAGLKWFDEHHQPAEPVRMSKFYPTHESWKGPAWWFEFPPSDVSDQNGWLNLLCQRRNDPGSFHHLRIPMGLFAACKHHLGYRKDKDVFSLFLSAEPESLFREMRGSGRIEFRRFEHECEKEYPMATKLTESKIMQALDWAYDKAVNGVPGLDSAQEMAEDYISGDGNLRDKVNSLIRWQITKAGTSGFLTGLGGILTMPVTIPANIASVMYIQIRMIAAIAHMGGHDLKNDKVKSLVYACLAGNAAKDILKEIGIVVGTKLTTQAIKNISGKTIVAINQKVGFRLLTKFGEKGAVNLGKTVPIVGGLIGGTFDSVATNTIGNIARDTFISRIN